MSISRVVIRCRVVLERMLASVSIRRCAGTGEPVGSEIEQVAWSTSKSAVSRAFVERTRDGLSRVDGPPAWAMSKLAVLMLDGIELKERTPIVCRGITTEGVKIPLGLLRGIDPERDRRYRTARRLSRARPRPAAGNRVRTGWREGTAQSDPVGVWPRRPGAVVHPPQGTKRHRPSSRA